MGAFAPPPPIPDEDKAFVPPPPVPDEQLQERRFEPPPPIPDEPVASAPAPVADLSRNDTIPPDAPTQQVIGQLQQEDAYPIKLQELQTQYDTGLRPAKERLKSVQDFFDFHPEKGFSMENAPDKVKEAQQQVVFQERELRKKYEEVRALGGGSPAPILDENGQPYEPPANMEDRQAARVQAEAQPAIDAEKKRQENIRILGREPRWWETFPQAVKGIAQDALVEGMRTFQNSNIWDAEKTQQMAMMAHDTNVIAGLGKGIPHDVARGTADVLALMAGNPAGKAGILTAAFKGAELARARTFDETGDENKANAAALNSIITLPILLATGQAASKFASGLLPEGASALKVGATELAAGATANVGTDLLIHAVEGQPYDWRSFTADALFALHGAWSRFGEAAKVKGDTAGAATAEQAATKVAEELFNKGETPPPDPEMERLAQNLQTTSDNAITQQSSAGVLSVGGKVEYSSPATGEVHKGVVIGIEGDRVIITNEEGNDVVHARENVRLTGEPNAITQQSSTQSNGDVLNPEGPSQSTGEVPPNESGAGVPPRGQGEDVAAPPPEATPEEVNFGPGAANAGEFAARPVREIGAYNADVDARRAARGAEPLFSAAREAAPDTWDNAVAKVEQDPTLPDRIIKEINDSTRKSVTKEDQTAILWKLIDLENRRLDAEEKASSPEIDPADREAYRAEFERLDSELNAAEEANRKVGTASATALNIRRLIATENFTYARMLRRAELSKGEPLTEVEKADVKKQSEGILRTEAELAAKDPNSTEAGVDESIRQIEAEASKNPEFTPEVKSLADRITERLEKAAAAALSRLRGKLAGFGSAPDPTILSDVVIYGASKIAKGLVKFGQWSAAMIKDFGDGVKPYLEDAWNGANKHLDERINASTSPKNRVKVKEAVTKENVAKVADEAALEMKARVAGGEKISDLRPAVRKLTETVVRGGIKGREAVVDAVHERLKTVDPTITRRQTMDLMSGYGDFKKLNPDAIKAEVRDINQQLQLVAKIQDVQAKVPLKKSGVERQTLSDESRRLTQELNENIKKLGVVVSDPATQLKTILAAQETRLTNRIKDLKAEIAAGERRVSTKTPPPTNEKIEALKKELAAVEAEHEKTFGTKQRTDEQKLVAAVASAKRAEAAEQARLEKAKKGIFEKQLTTPKQKSAELDAIKARTEAARAERIALEEAANPPLSEAQKQLDAALVARERWEQLLAGEIAPAKKMSREALTQLEDDARSEIAAMRELAAQIRKDSKAKTDPEIAKENAQVKALEKAAAEFERRVNEADFGTRGKTQGPDTARVAQARALRDAAKAAFDAAKEAANPGPTAEQKKINAIKASLLRRNADIAERIAKEEFLPRKKNPPVDLSKDREAVAAKAENDRLKKQFAQKQFEWQQAQRTKTKKTLDFVKDVAGASRSLITSADVSAPFRQGGFLLIGDLLTHPMRALRNIGTMFRQLVSEKVYEREQAALALRPNADLYQKSGLYFSDLDSKLSAREESMRSNLAERLPLGLGKIVRASNRAYTGFLNRQRADAFDSLVESLGGKAALSDADTKLLANAVNTFTGRGTAAGFERSANTLATYFFSPRFLASRIQTLIGHPIAGQLGQGASPAVRKAIARQYAKFGIGLAAIYGLSLLNKDAKVDKDPRSSDFGKIHIGHTRVDPLTGLQQVLVLMARTATGKQKVQGQIKPVTGDTYYRFARSKLAPVPGTLLDLRLGKNVVGEKVTLGSAAENLTVPMSYQDVKGIYKEHGAVRGTILEMLNLLGMGIQHYGK